MCGICGFIDASGRSPAGELERIGSVMMGALAHRGPDDEGVFVDPRCGVSLAFRRLAIVDLSAEGHQPMASASGRYVAVYNGEIYNHRAIRAELEALGCRWRGHSDTEVMLAAFESWGVERSLERFNGMFALALWDREHRRLLLARDRMGEKPLYYGWQGRTFLFASELKACLAHPGFRPTIDRDALTLFFRHNYINAPHCVYEGMAKLPPGTWVLVDPAAPGRLPEPTRYWSVRDAAERGLAAPFTGRPDDAVEALESLLRDAVRIRMHADVPLGAFLSGGIDSSTVVALMQALSSRPVRTFTVGFREPEFDEAARARAVARHLGTDHTELYVSPEEAREVVPLLPSIYDEPFADSSQIPTYLISRLARRDVTVSLSGDGGDELFGGYTRYAQAIDAWARLDRLPRSLRLATASLARRVPAPVWHLARRALRFASSPASATTLSRARRGARLLGVGTPESLYHGMVSHWPDPTQLVIGSAEPRTEFVPDAAWPEGADFLGRMMYLDMVTYLPGDILAKLDRASMAVGLEARVPLLDHRVVELAWRIPNDLKLRGGTGKWVLRRLLHRHVPSPLVERPKMGFGVPIGAWLRGPLRGWAEDLLDPGLLASDGLLDVGLVRGLWEEHLSGTGDWHYLIWDVLMFQAWHATVRSAVVPGRGSVVGSS